MRQAQKMQEEMEKTAELLDDWEIVGTAAGEAVVVYMNAKKIINGIELDESIVDPTDVEMLEDLIMAAINDGYAKADKVYEEKIHEHYMNYLEELHHKYNVQYLYTSLG